MPRHLLSISSNVYSSRSITRHLLSISFDVRAKIVTSQMHFIHAPYFSQSKYFKLEEPRHYRFYFDRSTASQVHFHARYSTLDAQHSMLNTQCLILTVLTSHAIYDLNKSIIMPFMILIKVLTIYLLWTATYKASCNISWLAQHKSFMFQS